MNKPSAPPAESQLSRKDIELLASLKGGMDALVSQVNSIQVTMQNDAQNQRIEYNSQMKELTVQLTELQTWRALHASPEAIASWNASTAQQKDLRRIWLLTTGFIGLIGTIIGIFMNQIWGWISSLGK